jgi:hypothetical protein
MCVVCLNGLSRYLAAHGKGKLNMVAKAAGVLAGVLIAAAWFWLIGARPVMETVAGLVLGLGGGLFAWHVVDRELGRRGRDKS